MQIKTQEHIDLMEFFERRYSHLRLDREAKEFWPKGRIYQNGEANDLFVAFREGAAYGKSVYQD